MLNDKRSVYDKALEFAILHYRGHLRKDKRTPILLHALRVAEILRRSANVTDDDILAAAVLHDVLEDTTATKEELEQAVGPEVTKIVVLLTEDESLPKPQRKAEMLYSFSSLPREAKIIKLADRLDNIRSSWIRTSDIWSRYITECKVMLEEAAGVCAELETELSHELAAISKSG